MRRPNSKYLIPELARLGSHIDSDEENEERPDDLPDKEAD